MSEPITNCPAPDQEHPPPDGAVLPTSLPQTGISTTATASQHCPTRLPIGIPVQTGMTAHRSSYLSGVIEWTFSESQSDIQGRTGSNACVFIALCMGKMFFEQHLSWPSGNCLPHSWQRSLREAMIKGNRIHDDLFDHDAINVTVEDAVSMAGEECGVRRLGPQLDIFGINPVNQLANILVQEAQNISSQSCSVVVSDDCAFLIIVNSDQSAMLIDSHSHGRKGAIIAHSQQRNIPSLAFWLDAMMNANWQSSLSIAAVTKIFY